MKYLRFLEGIRNPICDFLFSVITYLGSETAFLAIAIFIFWCVSKRRGYYVLITGLVGTLANQMLKLIFRIPRPWVKDPSFTIVESAREEAVGYSFPSGHTQNATGTFGAIALTSKRRGVRIFLFAVVILVAFSRNYLGVHTFLDVVVSLGVASLLLLALYPCFYTEERFEKTMPYLIVICAVLSVGFLVYANLLPEEGLDPHNLESGRKNAATLFGCLLGLCVVYPVDKKFIGFTTEGKWYAQVIKLAVGLGLVLALKAGLKTPLEHLVGVFTDSPVMIARAIRYFLIVIFAGIVWPLSFRFFSKMSIPALDRFTEKVESKICKKSHAPAYDGENEN